MNITPKRSPSPLIWEMEEIMRRVTFAENRCGIFMRSTRRINSPHHLLILISLISLISGEVPLFL